MIDWDVAVIGAGAAGLLAAARAAERGRRTVLLEKNSKPGVKILMSGGTRCNITHATDRRGIVEAFGPQGKFLHSPLAALGPRELVDLFEAEGVATKVEATGKVFPVSDKAADVLNALLRRLERSGAQLALNEPVIALEHCDEAFRIATVRRSTTASRVIVTTGGQSYPGCGTTGDGYNWATRLGHKLVPRRPALVPITVHAAWVTALRGVTVPDVIVKIVSRSATSQPCLVERRGSLLFTHFGLSGPAVLDISRVVSGHSDPSSLVLECDFLPGTATHELNETLRQSAATSGKRHLAAILPEVLPHRLTAALVESAGLSLQRRAAELSKLERVRLVAAFKRNQIPVSGTLGFKKAEVTAGGIALDDVNSKTMQSRIVPGLFFAGEVLDLDGPIGGYNFQAAFSTGWLAGENV